MNKLHALKDALFRFWKRRHLTQIFLLIGLLIILLFILYFAWLASRTNIESLKKGLSQSTVIYDKNGAEASEIQPNRLKGVSISHLPKYVPEAVVAIEDERFYQHHGFDIKGIARAFFGNLFHGRITGGGSTLTQQLTKNALLTPQQTFKRKVEELFLAVKIEKVYKKDEILQMYLNQVYFGSGAWGIGQASRKYFDKDITEVSISEAAMLAGLVQAPTALNPYNHYDLAMKRRNLVLNKMMQLGYITKAQYTEAINEHIHLHDGGGTRAERNYPYYVDAVLDEAINRYGLTQEEIFTRGYRIYTEMDQPIQSGLEKVYNRDYLFPANMHQKMVQSGAVLVNPASGGVLALVGGRGEHVFRGFNHATQLQAQPGSTMKPLAVYTPALEDGYDAMSELIDEPTSFGGYKPENFTKTYSGKVPMYKAVEKSLNIPAVWLLNKIGIDRGMESLKKFGIPVDQEDRNLAIALGGMHKGISPLQLANAFSAFANGGSRADSHLIVKIVGPTGDTIAEHADDSTQVTSPGVANEMTSMLLNVVESGTGKHARIPGYQIAAKTGSTQLPFKDIEGTKDQWMAGYTPNLAAAVWIGFDQTDREHYLPNNSSGNVVPIFRAIMKEALPNVKKETFDAVSINDQLANNGNIADKARKAITDQAEKIRKEFEANAGKIGKTLKSEAPKWKKEMDKGILDLGKSIDSIMKKIQGH